MPAKTVSKYKPEYIHQVEKLCLLGADDAIIANFFSVTEQTINNWKIKHPELFESIKRAKVMADAWREKNNDFGDQDVANITSVTFYPKALPNGYYRNTIDTTDDPSE